MKQLESLKFTGQTHLHRFMVEKVYAAYLCIEILKKAENTEIVLNLL